MCARLRDLFAVRVDVDRLFNRIARVRADGGDALLAVLDGRDGAEAENRARRIARGDLRAMLGRGEQRELISGLHLHGDLLRVVEIVAQDDGQHDLVALGQDARRIMLDEERLEGAHLALDRADLAVRG